MWLPRFGSLLLLVLGVILTFWPEGVIGVFPPLIGVILMVVGLQGFFSYHMLRDKLMEPGIKLVQSIVIFMVGFVFIAKRDVSAAFLTILFGLFVLVNSAIKLSDAISGKLNNKRFLAGILESVLGFAWGALLLFNPFSGRNWWARFLGLYFIYVAVVGLLKLRAMRKTFEKMIGRNTRKKPDDASLQD